MSKPSSDLHIVTVTKNSLNLSFFKLFSSEEVFFYCIYVSKLSQFAINFIILW